VDFVIKKIPATSAIHTLLWVAALFSGVVCVDLQAENGSRKALALTPSGTTATNLAVSGTNTSYVLSANDLIRVEVYKEDDLRTSTRVDQDGTVFLPLVKTVNVGGRTVAEARDKIRQLYEEDFLRTAFVTITVVESGRTNAPVVKVKLEKFTILGEVKKPGNFEIPEGEKMDIVRAIAMADGFSPLAKKSSVSVNRKGNGKSEKFDVDVQAIIRESSAKPFEIKAGDVIEVRQTVF
jgi:polysaccharide export outer membrane protein